MQKLKNLQKKRPALFFVAACYICGAIILFFVQLYGFVANRILYATGALAPAQLTLDDFDLDGIERSGNELWTFSTDPQMLLKDSGRLVENMVIDFSFQRPARTCTVFWQKPGQGYSMRRMAYSQNSENQVFYLPPTGVQGLRLDPDTIASNLIVVNSIAINQPRPLWVFFVPGTRRLVLLAVLPGLCASALATLGQLAAAMARRKVGATQ